MASTTRLAARQRRTLPSFFASSAIAALSLKSALPGAPDKGRRRGRGLEAMNRLPAVPLS
jgi:hypothetical protein